MDTEKLSDKLRWRNMGVPLVSVVAAVDSATVIEIGDLLWQDTDNTKPADRIAPSFEVPGGKVPRSAIRMQEVFADKFLGVAMQRSCSGDTNPVRVATTGVFEFGCVSCPASVYELGDLIGVASVGDKPVLLNQQVAAVKGSQYAIGCIARYEHKIVLSVLVDIRSTVMTGGVEGSSPSGV